jgi:isoquinoline 1-oxidoreductase alpha subunit
MPVTLRVNGVAHTVDVPSDMPLLWVLRDVLDLRGTKFGCGISQCGACTVHLDGQPTRACVTPASAAAGSEITTIEGLAPDGSHPLQRAWVELDVPQCGYCQAGQLMTAAALLERNPNPSDEEIHSAMDGNLCRCGTYLRIHQGIRSVAGTATMEGGSGGRGAGSASGDGGEGGGDERGEGGDDERGDGGGVGRAARSGQPAAELSANGTGG